MVEWNSKLEAFKSDEITAKHQTAKHSSSFHRNLASEDGCEFRINLQVFYEVFTKDKLAPLCMFMRKHQKSDDDDVEESLHKGTKGIPENRLCK